MNDEMALGLWWVSFCGGLGLLCFVLAKVMDFIDRRNDRKHHKEHPEYFRLHDDLMEKAGIACRFYNSEVCPRKRKVDVMLKEEPYWPANVREQKMEELDELRCGIYTAECMHKGLDKDVQEARQRVADYVRKNNIKWAGDWN